jgi:hypothetical protein
MTGIHEGGCLCGDVRYRTLAEPVRVTICHCTFCQKLTGSAFLVEPIFRREDVALFGKAPKSYDHRSDVSQKRVTLNFCWRYAAAHSMTPTGLIEAKESVATPSYAPRKRA